MTVSWQFLDRATRILFFTGKGGVGKTSLACATAVALARKGKRVLLVSTDPASNLDEALGVQLSPEPTPIPGVEGLWALNIDPEATPVHEAVKLQQDLLRAGIRPFAWVINQSFANNGFRDPVLVERGLRELPYIQEVETQFASRMALVPWKSEALAGAVLFRQLAHAGHERMGR